MENLNKDYCFYESTTSLCNICENTVPAKIIIKNGSVYILKYCPIHGEHEELLEEDCNYHFKKRLYDKPGTKMKIHTNVNKGCPHDCGTCPQHNQHACMGLIEITEDCNISCPTCYAKAGNKKHLSLDKIEKMMDFLQDSEYNNAEILQISGGEPTIHPNIIEILQMAKAKKFKYIVINTNGIRIAEDEEFVKKLSQFNKAFELYMQFDSLNDKATESLRGEKLVSIKKRALENIAKYKIPTTLVATMSTDVNDNEIGSLFVYALNQPYVRGINFQTISFFGRNSSIDTKNRLTISGVLKKLEQQTNKMIKMDDFIPLPCNVEKVAITYMYRSNNGNFIPITRDAKIHEYLPIINNTFAFTIEDALKNAGKSLLDLKTSCECFKFINDFKQMIPLNFFLKSKEDKSEYVSNNTFRVSVTSFIDKYNFDTKSLQKECVHVITEDLKKIPFSAYNTIYRNKKTN